MKWTDRGENMTYEDQSMIQKRLMEEMGGEDSEYESDFEEIPVQSSDGEGETKRRYNHQKRIFKYMTIQDKMVSLPASTHILNAE